MLSVVFVNEIKSNEVLRSVFLKQCGKLSFDLVSKSPVINMFDDMIKQIRCRIDEGYTIPDIIIKKQL